MMPIKLPRTSLNKITRPFPPVLPIPKSSNMPVHPSEEEAPSGIYEKIAKDPSSTTESTASEHESHDNEHDPHSYGKASARDFQSKGPQIPMNMSGGFCSRWRHGGMMLY